MSKYVKAVIAAVATAFMAAGLIVATSTPGSAATVPSWPAFATKEWQVRTPTALVRAGSRLFVPDGSGVDVLTEDGAYIQTITGVEGTGDAAVSPDGALVAVLSPATATLTLIDSATLAVTAQLTLAECPQHLAFSGPTLYYGYGCSAGAINHVDTSTGSVNPIDSPDAAGLGSGAPELRVDSGRLFALDSNAYLHAWPISADGLGEHRSGDTGGSPGGGFDVHGDVAAVPYGSYSAVRVFDVAAMQPSAVWVTPGATSYPTFTPDGKRLVVATYFSVFITLDTATGKVLGTSSRYGATGSWWTPLALSADGKVVYMVTRGVDTDPEWLLASSVGPQQKVSLALTVAKPATYAGMTTFTLRGTPGRTAVLSVRYGYQDTWRGYTIPLGADGVATLRLARPYSSYAFALISPDVRHAGVRTPTVSITVKAVMTARLSKGYKTVNGVTYYRSGASAIQYGHLEPRRKARPVEAKLMRWSGSRSAWVAVATLSLYTDSYGNVGTALGDMPKNVNYRVTFRFPGDRYNTAAQATTKTFRIG